LVISTSSRGDNKGKPKIENLETLKEGDANLKSYKR
jgi:hypothetical protein